MKRAACLLLTLAAAVVCAGCGDDKGGGASRLVDPKADTPPVNSLSVEPGTGDLLITTNRGFFRISDGKAERIRGTVDTQDGKSPVGTFLALTPVGENSYVGSGHPDQKGKLADFLGYIRTDDGGRNWLPLARYGISDLHQVRIAHDRIYAFDAVLGGVLISDDDGENWSEHPTPTSLAVDLAVDPEDPDYVLVSTEDAIFRTEDAGETWRSISAARAAYLAWPSAGELYRADKDGVIYRSDDRGGSWGRVGTLDGVPAKLEADGTERLLVALDDATILESEDGSSWSPVFEP